MAFYPCNIFCNTDGGIANIIVITNITTNVDHTFVISSKYENCILILMGAANQTDGQSSVDGLRIETNGIAENIFSRWFNDERRAFLRTIIYRIEKKEGAISIKTKGCNTWGMYTAVILA